MAAAVSLGALIVQLVFLAVVLSIVGYYARKIIYAILDSRQEERMRQQALVAAQRAKARRKATAA